MSPQSFFGPGQQAETYDQLQKQREMVDALLSQPGYQGGGVGDGLAAIGRALGGFMANRAVGKREGEYRERRTGEFDKMMGGGRPAIMGALTGPVSGSTGQGMKSNDAIVGALTGQEAPDLMNRSTGPVGEEASQPMPGGAPQPVGPEAMQTMDQGGATPSDPFALAEQKYGLPEGYLARTAQIESGGDPNAKNPNSSASGLFQFIDSTAAQYGIDPMDPAQATEGAARLAADNSRYLRNILGRDPTAGELYLAHQQGAGGAAKLLANPNARAVDVVGADAVRLNGGDVTMSARDFAGQWTGKIDGGQGAAYPSGGGYQPQPVDMGALQQWMSFANDPYLDEGRRAYAQMMVQRMAQQMDPNYAIDMQLKQAQLAQIGQPEQMSPYEQEQVRQRDERLAFDREKAAQPKPGYRMLSPDEAAQMGLPEGAPFQMGPDGRVSQVGGSGTTVNVGGGQQYDVGTIPQGYRLVYDEQGRPVSMEAIPGGPADLEQQAAGQKQGRAADAAAAASDTTTAAATRALGADANRFFTGVLGSVASMWPSTDNAEIYRQVDVLKSGASIENLTAMRQASPTGGALGSVTEKELKILQDKGGALDPASPNFRRDLQDYTRTLLRTIHGIEEGDRAFAAWQQTLAPQAETATPEAPAPALSPDAMRWMEGG